MNDDAPGQSPTDPAQGNGPHDAVPGPHPGAPVPPQSPGAALPPAPAQPRRPIALVLTLLAVLVAVLVGGTVFVLVRHGKTDDAAVDYTPRATNKDPSLAIPGIVHKDYPAGVHVGPNQRVAYEQSPPMGGAHDANWAVCSGVVYPTPVRSENLVHDLEHGAVWITYDPARISGSALKTLQAKVIGIDGMVMSPYPGLDQPISLQSWGHQLKLSDPNDKRIDHFVTALLRNPYTYPEPGATCANPMFDVQNPPPFDPSPPGPDAVPANKPPQTAPAPTPSGAPIAPGRPGNPSAPSAAPRAPIRPA
ncbi:DUF3105 domain-containing protein [Nocardia stercoris]|uniref:DUF3105 domain-containing protein n=1 Tax=Nocardia stercoris TaxID=2483361 RepID=UPI00389909CC